MTPSLHRGIPWWAKIIAKMALSRLPVPRQAWHRINVFRPGHMREPTSAIAAFEVHWRRAGSPAPGFRYLELGPGETYATAVVAWAFGAAGGALVDAEAIAARDMASYQPLFDTLATMKTVRDVSDLRRLPSVEALLATVGATAVTDGLDGLKRLPSQTFDFVFSHAVLEHVRLAEFEAVARELYRVSAPGAVASHRVDFKDHLQGSLHSLRISEGLWERPWFADASGFYTNRLRLPAMVRALEGAGFDVEVIGRERWSTLPLPRESLAVPFRELPDDDLLTHDADLILRRTR